MWQALQGVSPILNTHLPKAHLITIQQPPTHNQHSDIILLSYLLNLLQTKPESKIMFFGLRQNYAHYLSISKKLGKSLQQYLKKGDNLYYYQCFMHTFCSQLPLGDTSPSGYVVPPKNLIILPSYQAISDIIFKQASQNTYIFVDSLAFLMQKPKVCYQIYQNSVLKGSQQMVLGGAASYSAICDLISSYAQIRIKIQNDVGGYGRLTAISAKQQASYLWRWMAGKIQVQAHIRV